MKIGKFVDVNLSFPSLDLGSWFSICINTSVLYLCPRYVVSLTVQSLDTSLIPLQDYPLITQDWVIARIVQLLGKVTRDIACLCL